MSEEIVWNNTDEPLLTVQVHNVKYYIMRVFGYRKEDAEKVLRLAGDIGLIPHSKKIDVGDLMSIVQLAVFIKNVMDEGMKFSF